MNPCQRVMPDCRCSIDKSQENLKVLTLNIGNCSHVPLSNRFSPLLLPPLLPPAFVFCFRHFLYCFLRKAMRAFAVAFPTTLVPQCARSCHCLHQCCCRCFHIELVDWNHIISLSTHSSLKHWNNAKVIPTFMFMVMLWQI